MRSYSVYDVQNFPEAEFFETNGQHEAVYTPENTTFRAVGILDSGFVQYDVEHISRVRFRGIPYHHQRPVDEVSEKHIFPAFLHRGEGVLLMQYSKKICNEAAGRLKKLEGRSLAKRPILDLKVFVQECRKLYGSYFRDVRVPHVRSSALFGNDVNESDFYRTFQTLGDLSAVITEIEHDDAAHRIMVTREYGIGFYRELTHPVELSIILGVKPILDGARTREEEIDEGASDNDEEFDVEADEDQLSMV